MGSGRLAMGLSSIRFICCRKHSKTKSTGCCMVLHEHSPLCCWNRTLNSVIGNPSEYQHFWTVFVPNSKVDNTVNGRERKSWRGDTSDYKAGCEKALLTARNLQSERDRVVNELRKLSNESGQGKQYSGQKDRRRDRGLETEQSQRNKHARES